MNAPAAPDPPPILIGGEITRHSSFGEWHPLSVPRVTVALDLIRSLGWVAPDRYVEAPLADRADVLRFHDAGYLDALEAAERDQAVSPEVQARYRIGLGSNPIYPEMFRRPMTGAGGLALAARLSAGGGIVHCPGSGTHHGRPDHPSGFCYLNDVVIAMLVWQQCGRKRIAYVDLDAHHGDGVQDAFAADPRVLTVSVHEAGRWPFTGLAGDRGGGSARNLPVPRGFNDTELRFLCEHAILPSVRAHRPDAILVQGGADALEEDPLSRLSLSNRGLADAVEALATEARALGVPMLLTGGGGYNPFSAGRCWALFWARLNGFPVPDRLPPEAANVLRPLRYRRLNGKPVPEHWITTLQDAPREGLVRDEIRRLVDGLGAGRLGYDSMGKDE